MAGMEPANLILGVIMIIVVLVILFADVVIFAYWFAYKYKEYQYEKAYGPTLVFPPRTQQESEVFVVEPTASKSGDIAEESTLEPNCVTEIETASDVDMITDPPPVPESVNDELPEAIDISVVNAQGGIRSPFASKWSLVHPFIGIQIVLGGIGILTAIPLVPMILKSGQDAMSTPFGLAVVIVGLILQNLAFVGVAIYFIKGYGVSLPKLGFRPPTKGDIGKGLLYGVILLAAATLLEKALTLGAERVLPKALLDQLTKLNDDVTAGGVFEKIHSLPAQLMFAFGGAVAAPIGEEVFFRGLLYNGLKNRWGIRAAVILSAICFAAIHIGPLSVMVIIPMGILLAIAYEKSGSLWVPIIMHAVNNGSQFAIAMISARPGK